MKNMISAEREKAGLTQQALADLIPCHLITLSKLERGKQRLTMVWVDKIAQALDVAPAALLGLGDDDPEDGASEGLKIALRIAGGAGVLGPALGISRQAIRFWKQIPAERVLQVEEITDIPRHVLRPDLYPRSYGAPVNLSEGAMEYVRFVLDRTGLAPSALAAGAGISSTTLTRPLNGTGHTFALAISTLEKIGEFSGIRPRLIWDEPNDAA